jgi:hypothetical protein
MRFTYVEDAARRPRARVPGGARRGLTVVLGVMAGLALYELITFAIDYWRVLHG